MDKRVRYRLAFIWAACGLGPLNDKNGLIVDTVLFAALAQPLVFFHRVIQQSIAHFFRRLAVAFTHNPFKLLAFFSVAAVVNTIGIEYENIPGAQQCEFGHIGGVPIVLDGVQREIPIPIRMIFRDVQA